MFTKSSVTRRLRTGLVTFGLAAALATAMAAPASADLTAPNEGSAMETVYCDSSSHTVTVTFDAQGEHSGQYGGSDLFPYEVNEAVWVVVWVWMNGAWVHTDWNQINAYGTSSTSFNVSGTTYWWFQYAFAAPGGGFHYGGEWAHGEGQWGAYSDQYGYQTDPACYS